MLYSLLFTTLVICSSVYGREKHVPADKDELRSFLNDFGRATGRPTGDDVDDPTLEVIAQKLPKSALDTLVTHKNKLIEHRHALDAKEDKDAKHSAFNHVSSELEENSRRLAVDTTCTSDLTVLCDPASAAYSSGGFYEDVANVLRIPIDGVNLLPTNVPTSEAIEIYTDANVYAKWLIVVHAANLVLDTITEFCDAAANCAGAVPIIGDLLDCIGGLACTTVAAIGGAIVAAAEFGLDYADFHDGVLLTTQMQALFEDREHIIANQKSIVYEIGETESQIGIWFDDLTAFIESEVDGLEDLINTRFDELVELNIDLFNLQNEWLNTKLNSIGTLLRTPSGQRPGWNDQNTTNILEFPGLLNVPVYA